MTEAPEEFYFHCSHRHKLWRALGLYHPTNFIGALPPQYFANQWPFSEDSRGSITVVAVWGKGRPCGCLLHTAHHPCLWCCDLRCIPSWYPARWLTTNCTGIWAAHGSPAGGRKAPGSKARVC